MSTFRCDKCHDKGWRYDDDPALDFGGPFNFEIPCDCTADMPHKERMRIVSEARESKP